MSQSAAVSSHSLALNYLTPVFIQIKILLEYCTKLRICSFEGRILDKAGDNEVICFASQKMCGSLVDG